MGKKRLACGLVVMALVLVALTATSQEPSRHKGIKTTTAEKQASKASTEEKKGSGRVPNPFVDQAFDRLENIRQQRAMLAKQLEELAREQHRLIAQIRASVQAQRKALADVENRLEQFEPRPAPPVWAQPGAVPPAATVPPPSPSVGDSSGPLVPTPAEPK
jgi:hypothetical protein